MTSVTFLDLETTGVQNLYNCTPREQFRLGQWAVDDGEIYLTDDYDEMRDVFDSADVIEGHNVFYDLTVMYGKDSMRPLELAMDQRIIDTFVLYPVMFDVPMWYEDDRGKRQTTYQEGKQKPELIKRFLRLGNLTNYHGLPGKEGDLVALAKKYNPKGTLKEDLDFGLIPVDDPDFLVYAYNDIVAGRGLAYWMIQNYGGMTDYMWREMKIAAINNQMSKNGFRLDVDMAQSRVDAQQAKKQKTMDWLVEKYDFPTAGKAPWKSNLGKEAILEAFGDYGVTPEDNDDWPKSEKTGAPSFSKDALIGVAEGKGEEVEELATNIAVLQGMRTLPELALRSMWNDGYCHPEITSLQRSGRFSMTNPSLPIWGSRTEELAKDKEYFIASPGRKLVEMDYSNADQRIVAALSGDVEYAKRFEPGVDGHEVSGRLMFGDELYDSDPKKYRDIIKACAHGFAYGAGAPTIARASKLPESEVDEMKPLFLAEKFINTMNLNYPYFKEWRDMIGAQGKKGYVTNTWGRQMHVDKGRSFTQSTGLLGQSGTREILCDGLIRIAEADLSVIKWLVATVHDAIVWDIPEEELDWAVVFIRDMMETTYDPGTWRGQPIHFPLSAGTPADNWLAAGH